MTFATAASRESGFSAKTYRLISKLPCRFCGLGLVVCLLAAATAQPVQTGEACPSMMKTAQTFEAGRLSDDQQIIVNDVKTQTKNFDKVPNLPALELEIVFSILRGGFVVHDEIKGAEFSYGSKFVEHYPPRKDADPAAVALLVDPNIPRDQAKEVFDRWSNLNTSSSGGERPELFVVGDNLVQFNGSQGQFLNRLSALSRQRLCLYDRVRDAVDWVDVSTKPRKAIFILASRRDAGQGAGCGKAWSDAADYASRKHIQVFAAALKGADALKDWDSNGVPDVRDLTEHAGGTALPVERLTAGLDVLTDILSNQWKAIVRLCPSSGEQSVSIHLELASGVKIAQQATFISEGDYRCPLQPKIDTLPTNTMLGVNLEIPDLSGAAKVNVALISSDRGQMVRQLSSISVTSETLFLSLPQAGPPELIKGSEYTLTIAPAADQGDFSLEPVEKTVEYDPEKARLNVYAIQGTPAADEMMVVEFKPYNFALRGMDIRKVKIWAMPGNLIIGPSQVLAVGAASSPITIPVKGMNTGNYTVWVEALTQEGQSLAMGAADVSYRQPTVVDFLLNSSVARTALAGVGTLAGLVVLLFIWFAWRRRPAPPKAVPLALAESQRSLLEVPSPIIAEPAPSSDIIADYPFVKISLLESQTVILSQEIRKAHFTVGRHEENDIVIPVERQKGVSRQHLSFTFVNGQWEVLDKNSAFGTTLNGQPIAHGRRAAVADGAVLGLGPSVKMKFQLLAHSSSRSKA